MYNGAVVPQAPDGTNRAPVYISTGWGGLADSANKTEGVMRWNGTTASWQCRYPEIVATSAPQVMFGFLRISATRAALKVDAIQVDWNCTLREPPRG